MALCPRWEFQGFQDAVCLQTYHCKRQWRMQSWLLLLVYSVHSTYYSLVSPFSHCNKYCLKQWKCRWAMHCCKHAVMCGCQLERVMRNNDVVFVHTWQSNRIKQVIKSWRHWPQFQTNFVRQKSVIKVKQVDVSHAIAQCTYTAAFEKSLYMSDAFMPVQFAIIRQSKHLFNNLFSLTTWISHHSNIKTILLKAMKAQLHANNICFHLPCYLIAFSALTLLVRSQKSIRPVKNWVMRCWCGYLSGARCTTHDFTYGPANVTATTFQTFIKIQKIGLTFIVPAGKRTWTRMWANAQRDGCPAEYRWSPLFNATKFGWCPLLEYRAVTLPRCETCWNS